MKLGLYWVYNHKTEKKDTGSTSNILQPYHTHFLSMTRIKIHCFVLIVTGVGGILCKTSVATVRSHNK